MRPALFLPLALVGCLPPAPPWTEDSEASGAFEILPDTVQLLTTAVGCARTVPVSARNNSDQPVEITELALATEVEGLSFTLADSDGTEPPPWTLAAGEERALGDLAFAPVAPEDGPEIGTLAVYSAALPQGKQEVPIEGQASSEQLEQMQVAAGVRPLDLLIVADRSGSTLDDLAVFTQIFGEVLSQWRELGIDYHVLIATHADGCSLLESEPPFLDSTTATTAVQVVLEAMLGEILTSPEDDQATHGLQRAQAAMSADNLTDDGCNARFLRANAMLHVMGISDARDESDGDTQAYISFLDGLTAYPMETVFDAIGGGQEACTGYEPYDGFLGAVVTSGGEFVDFCSGDWATTVKEQLGHAMAVRADARVYVLPSVPVVESISVRVGELDLDRAGWVWKSEYNAVVLSDPAPFGEDILITWYPPPESCED
ncbi:MAG: hypothetical protein ABIO70_15460 [Pseudomonadota bacterium]